MTEEQTAEIFGFINLVTPYLDEMASRGDYQAKTLHEQAVVILEEEEHEAGCPATDGFGCRCGEEQAQ